MTSRLANCNRVRAEEKKLQQKDRVIQQLLFHAAVSRKRDVRDVKPEIFIEKKKKPFCQMDLTFRGSLSVRSDEASLVLYLQSLSLWSIVE